MIKKIQSKITRYVTARWNKYDICGNFLIVDTQFQLYVTHKKYTIGQYLNRSSMVVIYFYLHELL